MDRPVLFTIWRECPRCKLRWETAKTCLRCGIATVIDEVFAIRAVAWQPAR